MRRASASDLKKRNVPIPNARKANATKGLTIIYTGDGKGKTTAALGLVVRAAGYGLKCSIIQFVKGSRHYGELDGIAHLPGVEILPLGMGFVGILDDTLPREVHVRAAKGALVAAKERMKDSTLHLLILDEISVALALRLLSVDDVIQLIEHKPSHLTLVLTGRGAPKALISRADIVTEMRCVKHCFDSGIPALPGIDY